METRSKEKTIVLLDVHAILHRAYHALPEFVSSKGEPTGALYGLSSMLIRIITDLKPDYIIACYDLPEPTYRHEAYDEYKAGRPKTDGALVHQIERSKDIFETFDIPIYSLSGFEADDMLGTIVEALKNKKEIRVIIASGDMDTLQLVDNRRVQVYTLKKGINDTILYDEKAVQKRFGFKPTLLPDFKGLRGDPSDNIIGIKGIGEKTATTLVEKFGTIENMYTELKKDSDTFKKIGISERVFTLLKEGEEEAVFSKMLATIRRDAPIAFSIPSRIWKESVDEQKILGIFDELEFKTLKIRLANLLKGVVVATKNVTRKSCEKIDEKELKKALVGLWLLDSNITNPTPDDLLRFTKKKSLSEAVEFVVSKIKTEGLERVLNDIEAPVIPIVEAMNARGIKTDVGYLKKLSQKHHKTLDELQKEIWKFAGEEFNTNSSKQLGSVLFDNLGLALKRHKKTSTGAKSTKESELEKMRDLHPIIPLILKYRELQKLLSTYIDNLPDKVSSDGRLRATFLQTGTTTGRMSSREPNLQNIPIKTELGQDIRNAFVAEKNFTLVSFDYSQIELRIAAILSEDEKLTRIFKEGGDVHTAVAANIFNVSPENVDKEMRRRAKVINFGILYGMGVNALKENLGTDRKDAQEFYNAYFETFDKLARYIDSIKSDVKRKGCTETLFGRRRYFGTSNISVPYIQAAEERMAINAPFQGTCADVMKIAMKNVNEYIVENNLKEDVSLILQVHDELIYEVRKEKISLIVPEIKKIMEKAVSSKEAKEIPLVVNVELGDTWGDRRQFNV
ncbi:MAG: hypothetical protein KAR00_03510 [Candidatus Pacebacteria bacterium]|nr:hypothetical protein [Candidatus Paceibacterota bacterium]